MAFFDDHKGSGGTPGEVHILFDEDDHDAVIAVETHDHVLDLLDDVGLDSLGRFIEQDDLGSVSSARAMASCCCWPPDRFPPRRLSSSFSTGKQVEHLVLERAGVAGVAAGERAKFQNFPAR